MKFAKVLLVFLGIILFCWFLTGCISNNWTMSYVAFKSSNSSSSSSSIAGPGWSVIYNDEKVYQTIHALHKKFFKPENNDKCERKPLGAYLVGVGKSGTRELTDFMHIHPQIVTGTTEPDGSDFYLLPRNLMEGVSIDTDKVQRMLPCTYSKQIGFVKADRSFFINNAAKNLKTINPNMKIIVILREPISRLLSHLRYSYYLSNRKQKSDFNKVIKDLPNINEMIVDSKGNLIDSKQLEMSTYVSGLKLYLEYFSRDQILIVNGDKLKDDPVGVFKNVSNFLGLKSIPIEDHFILNPEKGFYCIRNPVAVKTMNCYGDNRGTKMIRKLEPSVRQTLVEYFSEKNEEFFSLAGQKFDWNYQG